MFDPLPDWIRQVRSQIPSDRVSNVSGIQSGSQSRSLLQQGNLPWLALNNLIFGENESVNELMLQEMLPELVCSELMEYPFITPSEEDIYGPINIGHCLETGAPAGIYPNEVHTLIAGGTGSGKTTLITRLIRQHINADIPVLIFDLENEFPELLDDNRINVRGVENLNWNPLEVPPGVDPVLHLQDFCAILSDTLGLLIGSKGFLLKQIHRLYELYGVFEGSNVFPSLIDLNDFLLGKLQRTKSNTREYTYTEVCSNRFDSLTKALPHILDCSSGMPLHILTRSNFIILLNGIDSEYQTLLITLMLAWLCRYRIANGLRNNPEFDLAVFLDEAQRLYDRQMERRIYQGIPAISHLTATVRKYNLKLFVAVQQPSLLASSMTANTFCKILMRLGDSKDNFDLGSSMFLLPEQIYYSRLLETGQAIVKLAGRWHEPFVIGVPYDV